MKIRTAAIPNFLELGFSVAHDCSKDFDDGDWVKFRLEYVHEDMYEYRCPKCKMSACIDVDIRLASKPKVKRRKSRAKKAEGRS